MMKPFLFLIVLTLPAHLIQAQPEYELSRNIYRSPYDNGETYGVSQDVNTHNPEGRFDLRAQGADDCNTHRIVAAAAGIVRVKVESNDTSCSSSCGGFNNYVWIQHANGEWTKYTHFKKNSVAVSLGDTVCAGTYLGLECSIGSTSPPGFRHLHFEVRAPLDPQNPPIALSGGFLDSSDAAHRIPVICDITNNYWVKGDVNTAANCSCNATNVSLSNISIGNTGVRVALASNTVTTGASVNFSNGANGFFRAGSSVTLTPGFTASPGSYFHASVGSCNTTPFPGGCN